MIIHAQTVPTMTALLGARFKLPFKPARWGASGGRGSIARKYGLTLEQAVVVKEMLARIRNSMKRFREDDHGNKKLGLVYSWSLLAVTTCRRSMTRWCRKRCYARKMQRLRTTIWFCWARNTQIAIRPDFARLLTMVLSRLEPGILRIHVSGEFFSVRYIRAWLDALAANPHIKPFAFTRVWRDPAKLRAFGYPDRWPVWLLGSSDPEAGPPPPGIREAKMSPVKLKIVRAGRTPPPALWCPGQRNEGITCDRCGRCPLWRREENRLIRLPLAAEKMGVGFAEH